MAEGSGFMHRFVAGVLRARWGVLIAVLAASAGFGYLSTGLTTNNDYESWLPEKDRVAALYRETDRTFASNALIFVALHFPEHGVFHPASLRQVARLTALLEDVPEVFQVTSLTNVVDVRAIAGGISVQDLVEEIPEDPDELARLEAYVLSREMYVNTVVSADARYTVILMNLDGEHDEVQVAAKVLGLLEENAGDVRYFFGGDPAIAHYMDIFMEKDMKRFVPLMFGVMIVILGFGLRRFWGVVLSLATVLLCITWTLGIQRLFGMPLNLLTPAVLVLLIALGSDYAVHAINHALQGGEIARAGAEVSLPILMSAFTTIAGLLTFATTKIGILKDFGLELAFGLGSACLLSVTFLLVMLKFLRLRPRQPAPGGGTSDHVFSRVLEAVTIWVLRHTRPFMVGVAVLVLFMGWGISRIRTDVDYVIFLPEGSPPRVGHEILRDHFSGIYPVSVYLRGDMGEPSALSLMIRMENALRSNEQLSGFTSVGAMIAEMNRLLTGVYAVPETREGVAGLWLLIESEPFLKTLVNVERDRALVSALVRDSDTGVMKGVADFVDREIPAGGEVKLLTLDPARLPPASRARLRGICMEEAAGQIASLAKGYGEGNGDPVPASVVLKGIQEAWEPAAGLRWSDGIQSGLGVYLREEAFLSLDEASSGALLAVLGRCFPSGSAEQGCLEEARRILLGSGLEPDEALQTLEDARWRYRELVRGGRMETLCQSVLARLAPGLRENTHFVRRAKGVLWELLSERPVVMASTCENLAGLEGAVVRRVDLAVDQTGATTLFRKFDQLLYRSQIQSLLLATIVVLILVSLTQRSLRRGLISILAVLIPLEIVIGLMGWFGIPLDFGTALFGALIIGLGIDGCIHILHHEADLHRAGVPEREALLETLRHVGRAVLTANATSAGGFFMLIFSSTRAVQNFAVVNAVAISLVTASILTLLPVLITVGRLFRDAPAGDSA